MMSQFLVGLTPHSGFSGVLAGLSWDPGFRGLLTVAVAVVILYGSVALILGTNSGPRLGFLLALTGLMGWFFVMGFVWSMYGIGYKGPAPSWRVMETVTGPPANAALAKADSLPLFTDLPDPVAVRDGDKALLAEFPPGPKAPTLGELVAADPSLRKELDKQLAPWTILDSANKFSGETQSAVAEALGPNGQKILEPSEYIFKVGFLTGGETPRTDGSIFNRVVYKITNTAKLGRHDPFYAAVQLQPVVPQVTRDGEAPPIPVADKNAPIYTVILHRDRGALRLPSISFTIFSGLVFAVLANMLHRRDKLAITQRAATAAGPA